jgi:hypothetical protein
LLWGNWFQHILFLQLRKNAMEHFARWNVCKNSPHRPHAGNCPQSARVRAVPPHLYTGSIRVVFAMNCSTAIGTLMQDLRQHAGVTGRREIGAIIGPCRCSDHSAYYNQMRTHLALNKDALLTSPDVLRAPREGHAAALLRNVMNSRRLIAAPEALDTASSNST